MKPAEIPFVAIQILKETSDEEQLVGLYLFIHMGYIESVEYFCTATEMVNYRAMETLDSQPQAPPPHPLEALSVSNPQEKFSDKPIKDNIQDAECVKLSPQALAAALVYIKVYLNDFTGVI